MVNVFGVIYLIIYSNVIFTWKEQTPISYTLLCCDIMRMKTFLFLFQDIENQLAIKSKALDELRESYLTLESGTMPLLEETASKIEGLFQKRSSIVNQVLEFIWSTLFLFSYPPFILLVDV